MNIVLWADLQCPFCLTGEANLNHAIKELGLENDIKLDIKSYEIHRPEDGEGDHPLLQIFQDKEGFTPEGAAAQTAKIDKMAKDEAGLDIDFAQCRESTDLDAHRLYKFAADHSDELAARVRDLLHQAYFVEHKILADRNTLIDVAEAAGLDPQAVNDMLDSDAYIREVRNDEIELNALNAESVPYFIVGTEVVPEHITKEEMMKVIQRNLNKNED